uniref:Uncharacterized protein n=1 Tax=Setaria digitata TaxID=48799 RepID=A0A915PNJ8_9BILA
MWLSSSSSILAILIPVVDMFSRSTGFALLGGSGDLFGCCRTPCAPKAPHCDCPCGFSTKPQFPSMLPPSLLPQFPAFPSGGYATPDSSGSRQQLVENSYLQQPSSYQLPAGSSNQRRPPVGIFHCLGAYHTAGAYGYSLMQTNFEQSAPASYPTGPYVNFGDYSTYSLPQTVQKENHFGGLPQQLPVSASDMGQYASGQSNVPQIDQPYAPDATFTTGTNYNSIPATGEYEKNTKAFLKMRKSQLL